ncbi:hypothetical protein QQM79_16410 [Marinobacteraceae bacterium S3BR75-40.1]
MTPQRGYYQYRILLAVSLAILAHAFIAVGFLLVDIIPEPPKTVRFELVSPGQGPQNTNPAPNVDPLAAAAPENPSPSQAEINAAIAEQIRALTETPAPDMAPEPQKKQQSTPETADLTEGLRTPVANPRPDLPPSPFAQAPSPESSASKSSMAGVPTPFRAPEDPAEVIQKTTQETQKKVTPYHLQLAHRLMTTLRQDILTGKTGERYIDALHGDPIPLSLQLKLMSNGALQRVTVTKSSGNEFVDRIMVQTALAASPYPKPPEEERMNGFLFNLDLVASPKYL